MSTDNPPTVSSGDLREDVAAVVLDTATTLLAEATFRSDPVTEDRLVAQAIADAAIAAVRAHDATHPEPWLIALVRSAGRPKDGRWHDPI